MTTELVVLGGGPAGYVAALRASQLGAKVTLVENRELGGTCLNRGCIPTKALLKSTEVYDIIKEASNFGVSADNAAIDFTRVIHRKETIVRQLVAGVKHLLASSGVEVVKGSARFLDRNNIEITSSDKTYKLTAQKFIIATGSVPAALPIPGFDSDDVLTSDRALNLQHPPESMVIIGGGVIGVEFATIFQSVGTKVTIIEMMPRLIPTMDTEIAQLLERSLKKRGVDIYLNSRVESIEDEDGAKLIQFKDQTGKPSSISADKVLVSVGRKANTEGLGLANAGVKTDEKGNIQVNHFMETNIPNIYAAGDVTGGILLAHVAFEEGKAAAQNALGHKSKIDYRVVPNCIFTRPEIASVGLSEEEAQKAGYNIKVGRFPFRANGKALTMNEKEGFVKIIADSKCDEILGVHIIGPHASDLIHEGALAIKLEATLEEIVETIHAHPTLAETMVEAALDADNLALHILRRKT